MSLHRSAESVLSSAEQALAFARRGADDYREAGDRRPAGLHTAITNGRSVTFILQNLRSVVDGFDDWYEPHRRTLQADPAARWFVELRNRIEKQGTLGIRNSVTLNVQGQLDWDRLLGEAPLGTVSTFIGDEHGRSGWDVELPDGTATQVFFTAPTDLARVTRTIDGSPHGFDLDSALPQWLQDLERIVADARERFGRAPY